MSLHLPHRRALMVAALSEGGGFNPLALGADLIDIWWAGAPGSFSLNGASVNAWTSLKQGMAVTQAFTTSKPVVNPTGINGRETVEFDGIDDFLEIESVGVLPVGAAPVWIWFLGRQDHDAVAVSAAKSIFAYGGTTTSDSRAIRRGVSSNVNRAVGLAGTGSSPVLSTNGVVDFTGVHVVRVAISGTEIATRVDSTVDPGPTAAVPGTASVRTRFASNLGATPSGFFKGGVRTLALTLPLSPEKEAAFLASLLAEGGIS